MRIHAKLYFIPVVLGACMFMSADMARSFEAPGGYTGAGGSTCLDCHGGNPLNATGGGVVINNLPSTYLPGNVYNFSVTINHGSANRTRWGFALKAVSSAGNAVGTLTENNTNVYVNAFDKELGHFNAPFTSPTNSFTFTNLSWTAPSNPTTAEQLITFYVAANASGNGDFIYASTKSVLLNTSSVPHSEQSVDKLITTLNGKNINVRFDIRNSASLSATVVNLSGQQLIQLPAQKFTAGTHTLNLNGNILPAGAYMLILQNHQTRSVARFTMP